MAKNPAFQRTMAVLLLILSLGLIAAGSIRSHKVYDMEIDEFGIFTFTRISDRLVVIDATFRGIERIDGKLYSTYDRAQGGTKRPCPT